LSSKEEVVKKDLPKKPAEKKKDDGPSQAQKDDLKKKQDQEDLIKRATALAAPVNTEVYQSEVAIQKNILIIGKAGAGKSTLVEVLKQAGYHTPSNGYSFFASGDKQAQLSSLVLTKQSSAHRQAYSLNVMDTPGMFEVRSALTDRRTNEQIIKLIQDTVTNSVTHLSCVLFLVPIGVISEEDLQLLNVVKQLLGEGFKKNTVLVFTRAENFPLATLADRLKEFLASEISAPFLDVCQAGVYFSGTVTGELVNELGKDYENKVSQKVTCLRQALLDAVLQLSDVKVDFSQAWKDPNHKEEVHPLTRDKSHRTRGSEKTPVK
jgi:GTPase SAR1 family protein